MVEPTINRRSAARMPLRVPATVELPGGVTRDAQMHDIGPGGLSIVASRPISPGTRCTVRFELLLPGGARAMALQARSVHSSYTGPSAFKIGLAVGPIDADQEQAILAFMAA
jgi:hypothetical protein